MDDDKKENRDSEYFIEIYNPDGGGGAFLQTDSVSRYIRHCSQTQVRCAFI